MNRYTVKQHRVRFESAEHEAIGNKVTLPFGDKDVSGKDFGYTIGSNTLSFGLIVALAGDFYGNWSAKPGDVEQISDNWNVDRNKSLALAQSITSDFAQDKAGYLSAVLSDMQAQAKDVQDGLAKGEDPAQVYKAIASKYDYKYTWDTKTAYGWIALCNWDHFGDDAISAYSSVHTVALIQALKAYQTQDKADLKYAYLLEGFAQHFLTDLLSSGHLRTPRRVLHRNIFKDDGGEDPKAPNWTAYPADECSHKMHDEDCANGLWVSNVLGESWAVYGDKQLFSGKSARNYLQAVNAAQTGVAEIWETSQSGFAPDPADYKALRMIPILSTLNGPTNFTPLFKCEPTDPAVLYFRSDVDNRDDVYTTSMPSQMGYTEWQKLLSTISESKSDKNMYPFTMSFLSQTNVIHVREVEGFGMIVNRYGDVDSGEYGAFWSMKAQPLVSIPVEPGEKKWVTAAKLPNGYYSLVGRIRQPNRTTVYARHVGFRALDDGSLEVVWNSIIEDKNMAFTEGDTTYGVFQEDSDVLGMVKYWYGGPDARSKLELWTTPVLQGDSPKSVVDVTPWNFIVSLKIDLQDRFDTFVGYGYNASQSISSWFFATWTNGYSQSNFTVIDDPDITLPAQAILASNFTTGSNDGTSVFRLFYGADATPGAIRIDVLNPVRDPSSGTIIFDTPTKTQKFTITWGATSSKDYLTWFLADLNDNSFLDLVGYAMAPGDKLLVVVFPGAPDFSFGEPIVSPIKLDPSKGTLFNADFMTPIKARQALYTYPPGEGRNELVQTNNAVLAFFDNYGLLGSRIIAPVIPGSFAYELKGQTPAIAGQVSESLGLTYENWMGRGSRPEAIGIMFD